MIDTFFSVLSFFFVVTWCGSLCFLYLSAYLSVWRTFVYLSYISLSYTFSSHSFWFFLPSVLFSPYFFLHICLTVYPFLFLPPLSACLLLFFLLLVCLWSNFTLWWTPIRCYNKSHRSEWNFFLRWDMYCIAHFFFFFIYIGYSLLFSHHFYRRFYMTLPRFEVGTCDTDRC